MTTKKNQGQQFFPDIQQQVEDLFVERPKGMPTLGMIKAEITKLGLPETDADYIHDAWLTNGFKTARGQKIQQWKAAIRNWFRNGFFPSQKKSRFTRQDGDHARLEKIRARPPVPRFEEAWQPPDKEAVLAYCERKKYSRSYGLKVYQKLVARNWSYYGQKITSDQQWQAVLDTDE